MVIMIEKRGINPPQPSFTKGGSKVGWISSLTINDGKNEVMNPHHMTMPGRFFIQKSLAQMVKNGCEYALGGVTSEGIKQYRHKFINFLGAVFTNLAPEHLEAHGGFDNYRAAKDKLFAVVAKNPDSFGVYNLDDKNVKEFLRYEVKNKFGYDDSLDAFGVHGIGGTWGALATGLWANKAVNSAGNNGLFYGNPAQLLIQLKAVLVTVVYSFVVTFILLKIVDVIFGLRVSEQDERIGLDLTQHREAGYTLLE